MRKINPPTISVKQVFEDCIDNVRNKALRSALYASVTTIETAEVDFHNKKQNNTLYLIPQNKIVSSTVNAIELKKNYTDRLTKKGNKGRVHYDSILLSAPNGRCPLCSHREANTLDHYLPKSLYPILSVTPLNLIPSCMECNKGKLIDVPTSSAEETLHPYYDDVESFQWLKARVISSKPFIIEFYTLPPKQIPTLLSTRIRNHFNSFELNNLYSTHSIEEFHNCKLQFTRLFEEGGKARLIAHLNDAYDSRF